MKLKSKWAYSYAKGLQGPMVSCDYHIVGDDLIFALSLGYAKFQSVIIKLNLNTQESSVLFEENHVVRTAGILENGRTYLTSMKGMAYCIDGAGEKIWETSIEKGNASFKLALDENCVYVSNHALFCLDKKSGQIIWKDEQHKEKARCNILLLGNYLYFGELGGKIFCLDKTTGKTIWEYGDKEWISTIEVLSADRLLVNHNHGWFYILDAKTGSLIKKINANGFLDVESLVEGNKLYVGDQSDVMMDAPSGNMTCYEIVGDNDLKEQFKFTAKGAVSSNILIDEDKLFFGTGAGYLYCIDKTTGQELMAKKKCKGACRSVILRDNELIVISDKGQVECFEIA